MLSQYGFQMLNDQFNCKTNLMSLQYLITAGNTFTPLPLSMGPAVLQVLGGTGLTAQSQIDNFLLTSNEFLLAGLNSTSVPSDSFGGVVKMNGANESTESIIGQCKSVQMMEVKLFSGSHNATWSTTACASSSSLTASSAITQIAVGANGDIAFKAVMASGFSALTSGLFQVDIYWVSI